MSHYRNGHLIETLAEGGYRKAEPEPGFWFFYADGEGGGTTVFEREWVLTDSEDRQELWFENPGHAGYTIVLPTGEELEFTRSLP